MKLALPMYLLATASAAASMIQPWCAVVAVAALGALCVDVLAGVRVTVKEARIAALEESFEKLKATAAAVVKVEARTSALERGVAAALRMDHD